MNDNQLKEVLIFQRGYKPVINNSSLISAENKMIETLYKHLRVYDSEEKKENEKISKFPDGFEEEDEFKKNEKYLQEFTKNINNFNINELILNILEEAHCNWILENKEKLNHSMISNAYKFAPFILLNWGDLKRYVNILQPILNSIDIKYDMEKVHNQFIKNKTCFLLENGIYSKKTLLNCMQTSNELYGPLLNFKDKNNVRITNVLKEEKITKQIAESVYRRSDLNLANLFKKVLEVDKNNIGMITITSEGRRTSRYGFEDNIGQRKFGFKRNALPQVKAPISESLFQLAKKGIIWIRNPRSVNYRYTELSNKSHHYIFKVMFSEYDECSSESKRNIDRRKKKLAKLESKIKDKASKYNEPGLVSFVLTQKAEQNSKTKTDKPDIELIQIEMTMKEIIELGYLPKELGWESKKRSLVKSDKSVLIESNENDMRKEELNVGDNKEAFYQRLKVNGYKFIPAKKTGKIEKIVEKKDNLKDR